MAATDDYLVDVKKRALEENEYVKNLIDNIPPIYYFDKATFKEINNVQHQELHNQLNKIGLSNGKPSTISKKTKLRRLKLIPERQKTVTQLLDEIAEGENDDGDDSEEEEEVVDGSSVKRVNNNIQLDKDELIQRLQTKINALRGGRKPTEEKLERQRLRRKLSKLKSKKNRQATKKPNTVEKKLLNGGINERVENTTKTKPIFNKEGKMVFSKFDFSESGIPERKKGKSMPASKDYKQLLEKVQNEKTKLNELKEKDPVKAELIQEKQTWLKAIQKAEGVKIKDDPALLKKALKLKEQRSKKSKKEWDDREKKVKEKQEKLQKKRKDNIKAKRDEKVKKKIKRAVKKGRYIPV